MTTDRTSARFHARSSEVPTLRDIIAAMSYALDLTEGAVPGHALRSCLIALRLAESIGLSGMEQAGLYYAALLKDVGCTSNSARMCQIFSCDERTMKAQVKLEDWTSHRIAPSLSMVRMLWKNVLPGQHAFGRVKRIAQIATSPHNHNRELIDLRCDRGASIVRKIGLPEDVALAVRHLDEHWDGSGYPGGFKATAIPILSRLMAAAQHLDAFCAQRGPQAAIDVMVERSGQWFDPEIVCAAAAMHRNGTLWTFCLPGEDVAVAHQAVLDLEPGSHPRLTADHIDLICEAFAEVIDAKSHFTWRHSLGVKQAAVAIAETLGISHERMQMLRRAALLHDLGKLSISNSILDSDGKLSDEQFLIVKGHPAISQKILGRISAFQEIATVTGEHHEKLDGSGYPNRLCREDLSLESRILAVADIYGALSEDRPYRGPLNFTQIAAIMEREVPNRLDEHCYEALRASLDSAGQLPGALPLRPFSEPAPEPFHHLPDRSFLPLFESLPSLAFQTA